MNSMLTKILCRQKPLRSAPAAPRFMLWAQAFAARHARIAARHEALAFAWLVPLARVYEQSRRWQSVSQRFSPQIHLALAPVLRDAVWREAAARETVWKEASRTSTQIFRETPARGYQNFSSSREAMALARNVFMKQQARGVREESAPALRSWGPLQLVFERMNEIVAAPRWQQQSLFMKESLRLVHRVQHATQRVEEKTSPAALVQKQSQERAHAEAKPALPPSPEETKSSTPAWPQTNGAPAINLEHLTEHVMRQIDRRMVIWRERTGRV